MDRALQTRSELAVLAAGQKDDKPKHHARAVFGTYPGLRWIAMTAGAGVSVLFNATAGSSQGMSVTRYRLPHLDQVVQDLGLPADVTVNPIGAGDTVGAGTLVQMCRGHSVADAFRWGLAAGTASCINLEGAKFEWHIVHYVYQRITVSCEE